MILVSNMIIQNYFLKSKQKHPRTQNVSVFSNVRETLTV